MPPQLNGESIIVTGAGRGIGRAVAVAFARSGARVTIMSRTEDELKGTAALIEAAGGQVALAVGDVALEPDVRRLEKTARRLGDVSTLVNCAGVAPPFGPIIAVDAELWWRSQSVHVRGTLLCAKAVLPGMRKRQSGCIINIVSLAGTRVIPNLSGYAVSKASVIRLTEHLAEEMRPYGVFAYAVEPGTILTRMAKDTMESVEARKWVPGLVDRLKAIDRSTSDQRLGRCADICLALALRKYPELSGQYLTPESFPNGTLARPDA